MAGSRYLRGCLRLLLGHLLLRLLLHLLRGHHLWLRSTEGWLGLLPGDWGVSRLLVSRMLALVHRRVAHR